MSTKDLSRTVIEGGRYRGNRYDRRRSHQVARGRTHELEHQLRVHDLADEAIFELPAPVYRCFRDKLAPAKRWLKSQVGRPWDKVRSELFARFDTRTTAGRHVLFDHLLSDVEDVAHHRYAWDVFYVSRHGILRFESSRPRGPRRWAGWLPEPEATLVAWLGGRRIIEHDGQMYWLVPTRAGGFRQQHRVSDADARRFRGLPAWFQERYRGARPASGEV
jgi:hypothetical protein